MALGRRSTDFIRLDDSEVGGVPTPLGGQPRDSLYFFNAAIAYAQSLWNGGAKIIVPRGQWFTTGDIVLPDGFELSGETPNAARIRAMDSYSGTAMVRNLSNSQEYVWCEKLYVDGRGFAPTGILFDTVFANSGIDRCVCVNHTVNAIRIQTTVIPGGSGPIFLDNVWALLAGQDVVSISGAAQVWARNLTAEHPGASAAACVKLAGNGGAHGCSFENVHLESNRAGCYGIVVDGATSTHLKNLTAGGTPFADIVRISNTTGATVGVTVDGIYSSSTVPNGIHDLVNNVTQTGLNYYPRYVTAT